MATLPRISIITPSFNQGEFLEATLESVLGQHYPELEYGVIDGGSTDGSVEILKRYADRLDFWVSEPDRGHADAINKGFARTQGEIMAWLNSDDLYTPWCFKAVAQIFDQFPQVNWIVGFNGWWNAQGIMTHAERTPKNIHDFLLGRYYGWIQQESVFWRRSLWEAAGGYISQDKKLMVDGELWSRFFLHDRLYTVDAVFGGYRAHGTNRAGKFLDDCLREMDESVAHMRQQCPPEVLNQTRRLRQLRTLARKTGLKKQVARQGRKWFPQIFDAADYDNIHWDGEAWVHRKLPYSLT
ncbi:glycosyltransferase involved in cell wall biosynthesis [Haloferula luteola]|uniref:Glycosyltransferase involved in cell wall biosynthesis n=1 Tax=Haloferula luteola TaxID=595692 RepID=A0A840VDE0_9BACT|nr:glycosyltransferase family 2 protein [Haloferula luteola]MBB5352648.1 glycosyltransferase involved in cell wall biosynthesis [Haloferula luteola]